MRLVSRHQRTKLMEFNDTAVTIPRTRVWLTGNLRGDSVLSCRCSNGGLLHGGER